MRKVMFAAVIFTLLLLGGPGKPFRAEEKNAEEKNKETADTGALNYSEFAHVGSINPPGDRRVSSPAFSKDGKRLGYLVYPGPSLVIVDLETGDELLEFFGWKISSFSFGPDGKIAGTASDGAYVWDANGSVLAHFPNLSSPRFAADGTLVAFSDGGLQHVDAETGAVKQKVQYDMDWLKSLTVSRDSKLVAFVGNRELKVFNLADGNLAWSVQSGDDWNFQSGLDFSPDGKTLVCSAGVYSVEDGALVSAFDESRHGVQFSPSGSEIISARKGGVLVHDINGKQITDFDVGRDKYRAPTFAVSPDVSQIASPTYGSVEIYGFRRAPVVLGGHEGKVLSMQFSKDASRLLVCCEDGSARIWDVAKRSIVATLKPEAPFKVARLSPDGKQVLFAGENGALKLQDVSTGELIKTYRTEGAEVVSLDFSPDGKLIASAEDAREQAYKVWDAESGEVLKQFAGMLARRVRFSPDGQTLALSSYASVWTKNVSDWSEGVRFQEFTPDFSFSPDSKLIVGNRSEYGWVRQYSVETGKRIDPGCPVSAKGVGVSAGLGRVAIAGAKPYLWNIGNGMAWSRLATSEAIAEVEFSPDGLLLAGSRGTEVCLWSFEPPVLQERRLIEHPDIISAREAREAVYASGKGFRAASLIRATDTHLFFFTQEADGWVVNSVPHGSTAASVIARQPDGEFWKKPVSMTTGDRFAYFTVLVPHVGRILFRSDGSSEGTKRVGRLPTDAEESDRYFVFKDKLFCSAGTGAALRELYCTDGSDEGKVVKNIYRSEYGRGDGDSDPHGFFVYNEKLYFFAAPELSRLALYTTDGTENGTKKVGNLGGGQDAQAWVVATMGDSVYITERTRPGGGTPSATLWAFNGASVRMVYQGFRGWDALRSACVLDNKLYFRATTELPDDWSKDELWVSDGQNAGTMQVKKFIDADNYIKVSGVTTAGGEVLVSTVHMQQSSEDARCELWAYNPKDRTGRWVAPFMKYSLGFNAGDLSGEVRFEELGGRAWVAGYQRRIGGTILYTDGKRLGSLGVPDPEEEAHSVRSFYRYGDKFACILVCSNHVKVCVADPVKETFSLITRQQ